MVDKHNTLRAYKAGKNIVRGGSDVFERRRLAHAYLLGLTFCDYISLKDYNLITATLLRYCRQG